MAGRTEIVMRRHSAQSILGSALRPTDGRGCAAGVATRTSSGRKRSQASARLMAAGHNPASAVPGKDNPSGEMPQAKRAGEKHALLLARARGVGRVAWRQGLLCRVPFLAVKWPRGLPMVLLRRRILLKSP